MPPRVLVAPNAYKGCLSAAEAARALARGLARGWPGLEADQLPVADGGDGTLDALAGPLGLEARVATVPGPRGAPRPARWGWREADGLAVVEAAAACGLAGLPPAERDPGRTTTRGVGALVRAALDAGARTVWVGLGGSATNDAGAGLLAALGARLLDADGAPLPDGGSALGRLAQLDLSGLDPRLAPGGGPVALVALCDVTSPLLGPEGATATFARQKGAREDDLPALEANLRRLVEAARQAIPDGGPGGAAPRAQPAREPRALAALPGAGAAGGLGFALALLGADLAPGAERVLDALGFDARARAADLVVTGEGALDASTARRKAPAVVAARARRLGRPALALPGVVLPCGTSGGSAPRDLDGPEPTFDAVLPAAWADEAPEAGRAPASPTAGHGAATLEPATAAARLERAAAAAARLLRLGAERLAPGAPAFAPTGLEPCEPPGPHPPARGLA